MASQPARILVVDDEAGMREGCQRILAPAGHQVATAASGEEALSLFRPGAFEVALIDLKMPGMSGLELLSHLRRQDPELVCVVITAYATLETAVQATKTGAFDYLAKPFTPDELTLAVDKALERHWLVREATRLRAEQERSLLLISAEQSRIRTIIQSMADGVMVINREGSLVLYNPALLRLLGIKGALPILGEPPSPEIFPAPLLGWMKEASVVPEVTMAAHEVPGGPPHLAANVAPIRDEAGEYLGAVAVVRDITELKTLEQAMSDFVSMVAHELRAPLGAIAQFLDVLRGGIVTDPERVTHILGRCRERVGALSQLVRDLLDFSVTHRRGHAERALTPLDLRDVLRETAELFAPLAAERHIAMDLDLPAHLPLVEADKGEMARLFTNLVSNAIKFNREGGSVRLAATVTDGYVAVEVVDTGLGIPQGALGRLGEAFFRVKTPETADITGTGLGLSICRQIIEAHHGHLEVESEEGRGSTFRVLLPRRGAGSGSAAGETPPGGVEPG